MGGGKIIPTQIKVKNERRRETYLIVKRACLKLTAQTVGPLSELFKNFAVSFLFYLYGQLYLRSH